MKSTAKLVPRAAARTQPAPARSAQLLDGLEDIFLREGFRRVTVGELAARLRCSRHTLYQLAAGKDALVIRVLDRLLSRIRRIGTEAAAARSDLRERIVALVEPGVSELRHASNLFFSDVAGLPAAKRLLDHHQAARRAQAQELIDAGIRQGTFRGLNSHLAAEVILAAVQRIMEPAFLVDVRLSPSEAIREAEELLLHGLLHLSGRKARRTRRGQRVRGVPKRLGGG